MMLHEMLADELTREPICDRRRLSGVPLPVIEEVIRQALTWMSTRMDGRVQVDLLDGDSWVRCEGCGKPGLPDLQEIPANPIALRAMPTEEDGTLYFCGECAAPEPVEDRIR